METTRKNAQSDEIAFPCRSDKVLRSLWGQWKTHVIYALGDQQDMRFGVLKRAISGISAKVLTQRLRELEADGFLWREQKNTIPPEVTYGLTEKGRAVHELLKGFDAIEM